MALTAEVQIELGVIGLAQAGYANLYDTQVLEAGKTDLELAKDDVRSLDIASALTDVGESRYAYVSGSKVYAVP